MPDYKLLTPGPLTTTDTVKREMLFDHCTWDDDYKKITQEIRRALLGLAKVSEKEYTAVLMQGSGDFRRGIGDHQRGGTGGPSSRRSQRRVR